MLNKLADLRQLWDRSLIWRRQYMELIQRLIVRGSVL
jgi:hypothetical protein